MLATKQTMGKLNLISITKTITYFSEGFELSNGENKFTGGWGGGAQYPGRENLNLVRTLDYP